MNSNADKCAVVQVKKGTNFVYTLNEKSRVYERAKGPRYTGVYKLKLLPRKHIEAVCSKVNRKTGMTKRCFTNKSREQMSKIYETVSRPVLEYASTVWSPWLKTDIELMESAHDRAQNLASASHGCHTLDERQERTQLTETYMYLNGHYRTPPERFFKNNNGRTREHSHKLFKQRARLDQKKNLYPMKIVDTWNNLPASVAEAPTIGIFKRRLHKYRRSLVIS